MPKPKKRISSLPQREFEICERIREVRLYYKWDQPAFARALGITRDRLASYEYGRAPLRFVLGRQICRLFSINQRWLATGKRPMHPYLHVAMAVESVIPERALFSIGYDKHIGSFVEDQICFIEKHLGVRMEDYDKGNMAIPDLPVAGADKREIRAFYLIQQLRMVFSAVPEALIEALSETIYGAIDGFFKRHDAEIKAAEKASGRIRSVWD